MKNLINGKEIAQKYNLHTEEVATLFLNKYGSKPCLHVYRIGNDPASVIYTGHKLKKGLECGLHVDIIALPESISESELIQRIETDNANESVHGMIVQLPLPSHLDPSVVINTIDAKKDVDALTDVNLGRLLKGPSSIAPCTPKGIVALLKTIRKDWHGVDAVVVGKSQIVGKPMVLELLHLGCTVTVCHKSTHNLQDKIAMADLVVVAIGKSGVIQPEWFKNKAVVIDVGINRDDSGKIKGDVPYASCDQVSYITPVPNGVGPMTVAMLLQNTLIAACEQKDDTDLLAQSNVEQGI